MPFFRILTLSALFVTMSVSFAYAGAAEDLMVALGMTATSSQAQTQEMVSSSSETAQSATTSTPVSAAASEAEQIEALKKLIATLTQQLAMLLQAKKGTQASSMSVAEKINAGICGLHRPLSQGVDGEDVKILQRFLISEGLLSKGSVSGSYGALTEKAVQDWQAQAGIIDHGEPYTTGYGLVNEETLAMMQSSCVSERVQNRVAENEAGAAKAFFVKKVPMTLEVKLGSPEKDMELSYTVKETARDPKILRICSTLVSEDDTPLSVTYCWSLLSYGVHTEMISPDFKLSANSARMLLLGHNIVKLKLELFDPTQTSFDLMSHQTVMESLGSDDTGTFDLFVGSF